MQSPTDEDHGKRKVTGNTGVFKQQGSRKGLSQLKSKENILLVFLSILIPTFTVNNTLIQFQTL